jgi:hypothetical protein
VTWNGHCGGTTNKQVASGGFASQSGGDYHLTATSPAVDSGNPADYPATDNAGGPRPRGGAPDAGAYELK